MERVYSNLSTQQSPCKNEFILIFRAVVKLFYKMTQGGVILQAADIRPEVYSEIFAKVVEGVTAAGDKITSVKEETITLIDMSTTKVVRLDEAYTMSLGTMIAFTDMEVATEKLQLAFTTAFPGKIAITMIYRIIT